MRHNPLKMEKWIRNCSSYIEQQYPMFAPFPNLLCDLDIYDFLVDNNITLQFDGLPIDNCGFTWVNKDNVRVPNLDIIYIHLGALENIIKELFVSPELHRYKYLPFRMKVEFVVYHEYGHWLMERADGKRFSRYNEIQNNVSGDVSYRSLPAEKWCDAFSLNVLKDKYPKRLFWL